MTPELRAALADLQLPPEVRDVDAAHNHDLAELASAMQPRILPGLVTAGRDSACMILLSVGAVEGDARCAAVIDARGRIRAQLERLGSTAKTLSQKLATRAPRGCHWVIVVDDQDRGVSMLLTLPGSEIAKGGDA